MITRRLEPQKFQPVYNEIITVLSSTKSNEDKFEYIVKIYVDGEYKSEISVYNNLEGYGVFDIHKHIEPFITSDIGLTTTSLFSECKNSFKKYNIELFESYVYTQNFSTVTNNGGYAQLNFTEDNVWQVGDEIIINGLFSNYDGVAEITSLGTNSVVIDKIYTLDDQGSFDRADGGTTRIPSDVTYTEDKIAFNGSLSWLDKQSYDYTKYYTNKSLLSNIPLKADVTLDDSFQMNFMYDGVNTKADYLRVATSNGVFLIENEFNTKDSEARLITVGVGVKDILDTTSNITVISGSLPIFDDSVKSYIFSLTDINESTNGDSYNWNIKSNCSKYEKYRLIYLDNLGGYSTVNFNLSSSKKVNVKKSDYIKNSGGYNAVSNKYEYNTYDRGLSRVDTEITEVYTIQTDWVNEEEGRRVIELMYSPEVYHLREDGVLLAINVMTNSLEEKKKINKKLFNYTINFEYSHKQRI